ncbi:MAG: nucleotidyltransferase domain-containing protein [Candidatus Riflebacteria bacterium]|nr:nucleotidyltransferase domain-containing protein [Candidatus Riflebacteria bacterium]
MNTDKAKELLKSIYDKTESVFPCKIQNAFLYGSYARGDYDEESDVDYLLTVDLDYIDIEKYRNQIAEISSDLSLENDVLISIHIHPNKQFEQYSRILPFYKNILKEGIRYDS